MRKRVLVIEKNDDIRDIIDVVLTDEGYEVIAANDQPLHLLHTLQPDLILLDEWLPNLKQGHLVCLELKAIDELSDVPVIILSTAHNIEEIACICKADGFVRKPFNIEELIREVRRSCSPTTA